MYCHKCKEKLEGDESYCPKCGINVQKDIQNRREEGNVNSPKKIILICSLAVFVLMIGCVSLFMMWNRTTTVENKEKTAQLSKEKENNKQIDKKEIASDPQEPSTIEREDSSSMEKQQKIENKEDSMPNDQSENQETTESQENPIQTNQSNSSPEKTNLSVEELAKTYYHDFLLYYKEKASTGFVDGPWEMINGIYSDSLYFPNGCDLEFYYTVIDLANDGVPELLISAEDGRTIYDAYCYWENEGQICPLVDPGDAYLGDRASCYICENNLIKVEASGVANYNYNTIAYYQMIAHAPETTCTEQIYQDGPYYYFRIEAENEAEPWKTSNATEEDFEKMRNKYPIKTDLEWHKLSEYSE